jgi:hypothetical protein
MYPAADYLAQGGSMDSKNPTPGPDPLDNHDEGHVAGLTGFTTDAARTFLEFHSGLRWLHHRDESDA